MTEQFARSLKNYRDLKVWQKGMDLVEETYLLTSRLPAREKFGLASQMQRSAVSIPSNISEGYGRQHRGDYVRSLSIANGSLKELETQTLICARLHYFGEKETLTAMRLADEIGKMLGAMIKKLAT